MKYAPKTCLDQSARWLGILTVAVVLGAQTPAFAQDATPSEPTATTPASSQPAEPVATPAPAATEPQTPAADPAPAAAPAPVETPAPAATNHATLPADLSPVGMFNAAHIVVKAVMIGLIAASLATWTIWVAKTLELAGAKTRARRTLRAVRDARTLNEAIEMNGKHRGPAAAMLRVAAHEASLSEAAIDTAGGEGLKERAGAAMSRIEAGAGRRMIIGTGILATVGSISPFVGLFGTVWGIMNSFISISESQTTNLAVVAPGIAEALLATAIGLFAAIPAVVIYNVFSRSIARYRATLADVATGISILISRDLDFRTTQTRSEAR